MYDVVSRAQPTSSHEYSLVGKGHFCSLLSVSLHSVYNVCFFLKKISWIGKYERYLNMMHKYTFRWEIENFGKLWVVAAA